MSVVAPVDQEDAFERRQRRLMMLAWGATCLPLIAFAYLTWESSNLQQQNRAARTELETISTAHATVQADKAKAEQELAQLNRQLVEARNSAKHYRDFTGVRIRFYRASDRAVVQKALATRGYQIDTELGSSPLIDSQPNTIGFGAKVADEDLRDIAVALVEAGFPLKRIAPAERQPDPNLIQIYASARSDRECSLLSVEAIRARKTCG